MPEGPSDFRSWQDELNLNGEQEQRLLDQSMQEAQATRAQANHALSHSSDEARQAQLREAANGGVATTTLSSTGSYNDYLRLKQQAQNQYQAAVRGPAGVEGMIRRQRAQQSGVNEAWTQQGDALEARQTKLSDESTAGAAGATRLAGEQKARDDAKAAAAKDRASVDEQFRSHAAAHWKDLMDNPGQAHALVDQGGYTTAARNYLMLQQGQGRDANFDPESQWGRQARTMAYSPDRVLQPGERTDEEKKSGNYGEG